MQVPKIPVCPTIKSCAASPSRPRVKFGGICLGAAFYDKYNADRSIASTLKQTADDYRNWYVRESEIPVEDFAKVEFLAEDGTYKDEKDIPGFALTDIAPELFE